MKNSVIRIDQREADRFAEKYFIENSGLGRQGSKFDRMRAIGEEIKKELENRVDIKAVVSSGTDFYLAEDCLRIDGSEFHCKAFTKLAQDNILAVYAYIVTAGEYYFDGRPIMEQLLADFWGTSYVDAGRDILELHLMDHFRKKIGSGFKEDAYRLSKSFGPGFYGMPTEELKNMFDLVDGTQIGVSHKESGIMVPLKSCTGIYLVVTKDAMLPEKGCEKCLGNVLNCKLCNMQGRGQ